MGEVPLWGIEFRVQGAGCRCKAGYQSKVFEKNEKSPKLFSQWYSSGIGIPTMKQTRTHEPAGGDVRDDPDSHVRNAHQP